MHRLMKRLLPYGWALAVAVAAVLFVVDLISG